MPRTHNETTSQKAASAAGKTLANPNADKAAKSAAASALTQYKAHQEMTGAQAASAAAKTLANPNASKAAKSAAGSALTQRPGKKK